MYCRESLRRNPVYSQVGQLLSHLPIVCMFGGVGGDSVPGIGVAV